MNHIYRVVFNHSLGVYQCASELAKTCGKSSGKSSTSTSNNNFALRALSTALFSVLGLSMASLTHSTTYDNGAVNIVGNGYTIVDDIVKNDGTILKNNDDDVFTNHYMQMSNDQEVPSRLLITDKGIVQTDQFRINNSALVDIEAGGRLEANEIYTNGYYLNDQQLDNDININVNGPGSLLKAQNYLGIRSQNAGTTTLTVENGGTVEAGYLEIYSYGYYNQDNQPITTGETSVNVDGAGSSLKAQDWLSIGSQSSETTLTVENGGTAEANSLNIYSYNYYNQDNQLPTTSKTSVNVDGSGSSLKVQENVRISSENAGTTALTVKNGGTAEAGYLEIYSYGYYNQDNQPITTGETSVNVDGAGSSLKVQENVRISSEYSGTSTLSVKNGGTAEANSLDISSYGYYDQSNQPITTGETSVNVDGVGSSLKVQESVLIRSRNSGTSTLTIENGGTAETGTLYIGSEDYNNLNSTASKSIVNVSGNGSSLTVNDLYAGIGSSDNGPHISVDAVDAVDAINEINITNEAVLNSNNAYIGSFSGVDAKVSLASGAQWNNAEAVYIGTSTLPFESELPPEPQLEPQPEVELETALLEISGEDTKVSTMDLFVGAAARGKGQVDVTDQSTLEVTRQLQLGGSDTEGADAVGELTVDNATLIAPITVVGAFGSGTLNVVNNGVIKTQNIERFENSAKSEVNFDNGTLELTEFQPELFRNFTGDNLINLGAGGGTIDTAGFNARLFENTMLAGGGAVITGAGDFTKKGTGMLAMATTAKQWTGATNIKQGTLSLDGDYTMRDGEILGISLNSLDDYGQLVVTGAADISQGQLQVDASEAVTKMTGNNEWSDIITASSRTGEFTAINDNSPLVSFEADYSDAKTVNLKMIVPVVIPEPPVVTPEPPVVTPEPPVTNTTFLQSVISRSNRNDTGIAYVLDKAIQDRVTNGDNALADSLISSTLNFNQSQLATAANQLQPLFLGATNRIITDANYAASDAIQEHSQTVPQRNLWAQLIGNNGSHDAEEGVTGYDSEAYGAIVGLDTPINSDLNLGVAFSYIKSDADTDGTSLDQELTAKNWQVLGYGNYAVSDATDLNFHAGLGKSDVEGERRITILTDAVAQSDYSVDTLQAGLGVAHRIGTQQRNVTPFAQVNYARAESDSYRETGAGVYNLNVDENTYESMRWTAGLRLSQALTPALALTGQLAAAVENGDRRSDVTASFISMPNDKFTTIGQEIGSEIGIAGIGLSYTPTINTKLSVGYRGEWRDNYDSQGANVSLQTTF